MTHEDSGEATRTSPSTPAEAAPPVSRQPRWSGKKTAVVAALAIGFSSAGAITASATVPSGSGGGAGRMGGGGFRNARTFEVPRGAGSERLGSTGQRGNGMPDGAPTVAPSAGGQPGPGSQG